MSVHNSPPQIFANNDQITEFSNTKYVNQPNYNILKNEFNEDFENYVNILEENIGSLNDSVERKNNLEDGTQISKYTDKSDNELESTSDTLHLSDASSTCSEFDYNLFFEKDQCIEFNNEQTNSNLNKDKEDLIEFSDNYKNNPTDNKTKFKKWNSLEEMLLKYEVNDNVPIDIIASLHKRTTGAIQSRIKKLDIKSDCSKNIINRKVDSLTKRLSSLESKILSICNNLKTISDNIVSIDAKLHSPEYNWYLYADLYALGYTKKKDLFPIDAGVKIYNFPLDSFKLRAANYRKIRKGETDGMPNDQIEIYKKYGMLQSNELLKIIN